ncbi:MAG: hypothetical protein U0163_20080 [Gemmatimonadaceae bacterium]
MLGNCRHSIRVDGHGVHFSSIAPAKLLLMALGRVSPDLTGLDATS